jgi:hypothetical protein
LVLQVPDARFDLSYVVTHGVDRAANVAQML